MELCATITPPPATAKSGFRLGRLLLGGGRAGLPTAFSTGFLALSGAVWEQSRPVMLCCRMEQMDKDDWVWLVIGAAAFLAAISIAAYALSVEY
jgi:hypothetical protein